MNAPKSTAPKSTAPEYNSTAFICPHCGVYAHQLWTKDASFEYETSDDQDWPVTSFRVQLSWCMHCDEQCLWLDRKLIVPNSEDAPPPNGDLHDDIKADYMEAASVLQKSPRSAAALLRLALQKLCKQLGGKGKNIQQDIDLLVAEKGLPSHAADAMDAVRIVGNHAVHPGELDLRGDTETATILFALINFIAETMLTEPKKREAFYARLPGKRKNRGNGE